MDSDGTLWIGMAGGGLSRLKNGRFSTLTTEQGLLSNVIGQLLEDDLGYLWMGTTAGIARARKQDLLDAMDGKISFVPTSSYGKAEGLLQSECQNGFQPACLKARDGTLWFCTIGGVVVIDLKRIQRNEIPPPVHIEKLMVDDKTVIPNRVSTVAAQEPRRSRREEALNKRSEIPNPKSETSQSLLTSAATLRGNEVQPVIIPAETARLEVRYTGLSLVAPEKVRFRYRLEGYDSEWRQAGFERVAQYTKVPPGHYRFRVTAANNDGVWNETGAALAIWVHPHYWQAAWFRVAAGLPAVGLIFGLIWPRLSHARRVQALRLRIAHDLHDEVGSNLGSIQLLTWRAHKQFGQPEDPRPQLTEIHGITAAIADSIRDVVWLIDPEFDTLEQMLKGMESLCARLLENIPCDIRWNVARKDRTLSPEFRSNFFLMFKEILHNIQKHACAARVEIDLTEEDGSLLLRVQDNGIGFELEADTQGHGLSSLKLLEMP